MEAVPAGRRLRCAIEALDQVHRNDGEGRRKGAGDKIEVEAAVLVGLTLSVKNPTDAAMAKDARGSR